MDNTKIALIGHRGVGKTELLERLRLHFPQFEYFDLDTEITRKLSNPIYKIFETFGEDYFRSKEIEVARELLNKKNVIVSLGAGFNLDLLPEDVTCIWVRRVTDVDGRIFLNRPALNSALSPIDDYLSLFEKRSKKYFDKAKYIYDMPEGIQILEIKPLPKKGILVQEKNFFKDILFRMRRRRSSVLTLNSRNVNTDVIYDSIELRTDLFSAKEIIRLVEIFYKKSRLLLSFRKNSIRDLDELADLMDMFYAIDIDVDLIDILTQFNARFSNTVRKKLIVSCHAVGVVENIQQLGAFSSKAILVKCSPIVKSFSELRRLYIWWSQDSSRRLIFPRSSGGSGDWCWFRQFMLSKQVFNFVTDGFSNVMDQPTILDTFLYSYSFNNFAAVIGNPVHHSYSPVFHYDYMRKRGYPYYRIKIEEKEFDEAMDFLEELGLKMASVTSPYKEAMYRKYIDRSFEDLKIKSVNTIFFSSNKAIALTNTDTLGLAKTLNRVAANEFRKPLADLTVVLWGGGGVVAAIKNELPSVHLVASRDGILPKGFKKIDILIWAAPRSLLTKIPKNCTIKSIFDLSYGSNSMGLELAKEHKITYYSGLEMFKEQGKGQQIFWSHWDERK